ncbi:MAG: hypothetical protein SPK96_08675, partial [Bacteroidaceae bacterium]|nr:hypothetical protein [Bacteroidaceae bacterium]
MTFRCCTDNRQAQPKQSLSIAQTAIQYNPPYPPRAAYKPPSTAHTPPKSSPQATQAQPRSHLTAALEEKTRR